MKGNNMIPNTHNHKNIGKGNAKVNFNQAIKKIKRRVVRERKIKGNFPMPSQRIRPAVLCVSRRYNSKRRLGRGFTFGEIKKAGIASKLAQTIGIAVDRRRKNKSVESLQENVQRLKAHLAKLILFPKNENRPMCQLQIRGPIAPLPAKKSEILIAEVTAEMKKFNAFSTVRQARSATWTKNKNAKKNNENMP